MLPLVSIITPVYNADKYLSDTIDSVINQEYTNWELILIDDCSKDNSKSIIEKYKSIDSRIKSVYQKNNGGVAKARNAGIDAAKGKYIAFLDSDDLWTSEKLKIQIDFMEKNNYSFSYTNYLLMDSEGISLGKTIYSPEKNDFEELLLGNSIGCLTVVIRKEAFENLRMKKVGHEDYLTWLEILKKGYIAYGINQTLALYRKTNNSLSSNKLKAVTWTWNIYRNELNLSYVKSIKCMMFYILKAIKK